jgi:hypothetical protein
VRGPLTVVALGGARPGAGPPLASRAELRHTARRVVGQFELPFSKVGDRFNSA